MKRGSLRAALAGSGPLVTPLAHDALSAKLIEAAGFRGFAIGGSALLAARHALPDIGLIGLQDMVGGIRDIAAATSLPFFADGDDGYGDVKSVARMIEVYESLGVGAVLIEDQDRDKKQQRAERALGVVDAAVIEQKLRVALATRGNPETVIIGRTDAYGALGLDEALRRAERFLALGVDGVFIAGLKQEADYERVGRALKGALLSAAMFEGGDTPWLSPHRLGQMGFGHVSFPATLIFRVVDVIATTLAELKRHAEGGQPLQRLRDGDAVRRVLDDALDLARWRAIDTHGALAKDGAAKQQSKP
jgi:2-methylisocitrate lyase-like PEP mutase family enzyme